MRACLSHSSALAYLLRMPNLRRDQARVSRASSVPASVPGAEAARALLHALEHSLAPGSERLDLLVGTRAGRYRTSAVRAHLCSSRLPPGSFISAGAYGIDFHLSAPELVFLQMAEELELDQLVYVGYALCSDFRLDDVAPGGCASRTGWDEPLTTVARTKAYLERLEAGTRNRAKALRALEHVRSGSRSPREAAIAMLVGPPARLGGRALGQVEMNREVKVYDGVGRRGVARWVTRIPDVLVTARDRRGEVRRVGIDYDPTSTHGTAARVEADIERRNLIAAHGGFTHITLGSSQVNDYEALDRELDRVRRCLGQRPGPRLAAADGPGRARALEARARARQFELWSRLVGAERLEL